MPISDLLSQISGEPTPPQYTASVIPKRKADDNLLRPFEKLQKTATSEQDGTRQNFHTSHPIAGKSSTPKVKSSLNGHSASDHSIASPVRNGQNITTLPSSTIKPPKKGSYAEIMARGKAAQANLGPVRKIQHKPIQKPPTKRELDHLKTQKSKSIQKALGPDSKFGKVGQQSLPGASTGIKEHASKAANILPPEKKAKKAALATTGYSGTARPKPGSSKGLSSRQSGFDKHSRQRQDRHRHASGSSARYGYASEEEEEDDELGNEEGNDYASDVSSDMEAAVFEVDEEEELAAKIARKEDAEALAEENRLKREKEEKKRRLVALAAKARRK